MSPSQSHPEACHNCRRRRLKCDRSLPRCLKCSTRGEECLGYQRLLRWQHGIASRGKMACTTFEEMAKDRAMRGTRPTQVPSPTSLPSQPSSSGSREVSPLGTLTDPLMQDVSFASRKYLFYFASDVCKDLVLYDIPKHNPFRDLIPLSHQYPILLQIIVANSALHMSNACQKSLALSTTASSVCHRNGSPASSSSSWSEFPLPESYKDALVAKQRALYLLKSTLTSVASADIDVTLAVVLMFIEFELIDSGRDNWRHHINGARTLIETLYRSSVSTQTVMSPLRKCLISNCLVFDILGSTLTTPIDLQSNDTFSNGNLSLLQDAEGNHCSSFPAILLQVVQSASRLAQTNHPSSFPSPSINATQQDVLHLLNTVQSFDPLDWAANIQLRSPAIDLAHRAHVASAHRAAVYIYLSRTLTSLFPTSQLPQNLESLTSEIIDHLSFIRPDNALFTAITWPAFIAGAETTDCMKQTWVVERFHELWEVEPWGLIRGALGVLERIWAGRRLLLRGKKADMDWIGQLRAMGVDWLII